MKEDKHIEKLIDQMMQNQELATPSTDFTSKVMNQVLTAQTNKAILYKPLISKRTFITVFSILLALIVCSFFYDTQMSSNWIAYIDFIPFNKFTSTYQFSTITTYTIVLTAVMLCIQIPLLKNYFDKRFEV